jgi:hypothetical protein
LSYSFGPAHLCFLAGVIRTFARRMRRNLLWSVAAILWITYIAYIAARIL